MIALNWPRSRTIDGTVIGGRGINGTPGKEVVKNGYKVNDDSERQLLFSSIQTTGPLSCSCRVLSSRRMLPRRRQRAHGTRSCRHRQCRDHRAQGRAGAVRRAQEAQEQPVLCEGQSRRGVRAADRARDEQEVGRPPGVVRRHAWMSLLPTLRRLGEELPARQGSRYNSSWKPPKKRLPYDPDDDQPYVVFKFAYAPRGTCRSVPYATTEGVQKFCWRRVSYLRSNWPQHPRRTQPGHLPHNLHRQQPCFEKTLRWLISRSIPSPNVPKQSQT